MHTQIYALEQKLQQMESLSMVAPSDLKAREQYIGQLTAIRNRAECVLNDARDVDAASATATLSRRVDAQVFVGRRPGSAYATPRRADLAYSSKSTIRPQSAPKLRAHPRPKRAGVRSAPRSSASSVPRSTSGARDVQVASRTPRGGGVIGSAKRQDAIKTPRNVWRTAMVHY